MEATQTTTTRNGLTCKVSLCVEKHKYHYCRTCKTLDVDHFTRECPTSDVSDEPKLDKGNESENDGATGQVNRFVE